jgi:hypothetical protein
MRNNGVREKQVISPEQWQSMVTFSPTPTIRPPWIETLVGEFPSTVKVTLLVSSQLPPGKEHWYVVPSFLIEALDRMMVYRVSRWDVTSLSPALC